MPDVISYAVHTARRLQLREETLWLITEAGGLSLPVPQLVTDLSLGARSTQHAPGPPTLSGNTVLSPFASSEPSGPPPDTPIQANTTLAYSTLLGGSDNDYADDLAVDTSGAAYVVGRTYSTDFPGTSGVQSTGSNGHS